MFSIYKKKLSIFFLAIFLIFIQKTSANTDKPSSYVLGCNTDDNQNYLKNIDQVKIKKIEIDVNNYRRWTVNSIRIITNESRWIDERYKRRFNSKIRVIYENDIQCVFNGRIRHSGDQKDHIKLKDNSIVQSLDVHLVDGNIKGVTKFKLYLPGTRGIVEDELIMAEILKNLDYLSPRTYQVNVRINQVETEMMFREKAAKELLEFNKRREGPILEADERFFFKKTKSLPDNQLSNWSIGVVPLMNESVKHMLSKQLNARLIYKSENHKKMSYEALTNLNLIYLYYSNKFQNEKNNYNFFDYDLDNTLLGFSNPEHILKLDIFNLLMQATNSQHGLSASNRKFYWNSLEGFFEPIYYDANINIGLDSPTTTSGDFRLPISEHFYKSFDLLEEKLLNLDIKKIHNNMIFSGSSSKELDIKMKVNKILSNLDSIKNKYLNLDEEVLKSSFFKPIDHILNKFNDTLNQTDPNVFLVKHEKNTGKLQRCEIYLKNCEDYIFQKENLADLIEGEFLLDGKIYQYLGKNLDFKNIMENENYNKLKFKKSTIYYDNGIEVDNDLDNNLLNIYQKIPGSRIYMINGELNDLTINFIGNKIIKDGEKLKNYPTDVNGLTGCLSLINLKAKNVSIKAERSSCEDAVNLINVEGTFNKIDVKNSFSDGLDIDFSKVEIEDINVLSSKNDCVDFSSGNYKLNKLNLINCGDKGLSVGEKSFLLLNEIKVENSDIGVASKDSSITQIITAYFKNLGTCVSAYNKKQEFYGGFLKIKNMKCENYINKTNSDITSKIIVENEL